MDTTSTVERVGATKFTAAPDRAIVATMDPSLPPIEQPLGLSMKLAYYCTRQQCGTVLTPLQVHRARLPPACGLFSTKVGKLDTKLTLPPETALLIREQVARLNVCLFCMDMGRSFTIKASMHAAKCEALADAPCLWFDDQIDCTRLSLWRSGVRGPREASRDGDGRGM